MNLIKNLNCPKCGNENQTGKFCSICGTRLVEEQEGGFLNEQAKNVECDYYEIDLKKKKERELIGIGIAEIIGFVLCIIAVWNNFGYRDWGEIVIICVLIIVVVVAIYNAIAASMGFYNAGKNLEKYIQLKKSVGNVEAIKIMEQTINIKEGYAMLNAGIKAGVKGFFGFIITIMLTIIVISLC